VETGNTIFWNFVDGIGNEDDDGSSGSSLDIALDWTPTAAAAAGPCNYNHMQATMTASRQELC